MKNILILCSLLLGALCSHAETVERVAAIVNSEPILESDFRLLQSKAKNQPNLIDDYIAPEDRGELVKGDRKALLDYLVGERIFSSEIKRLNLSVTMERVEQEVKEIAKRNGIGVNEVYQSMQSEGIAPSEYQAYMKDRIERQSLIEVEIASKIRVSDDDALSEFVKTHADSKSSINEFTVSHIFFDPKKGGAEAAWGRANAALKKLKSGESFEALADKISEDPNFSSGGLLGTFKSGEFMKEIEDSIAGLSVGQTTDVVKSHLGFHIVKLLNKKVTSDPRFDKEKDKIKSALFDRLFRRQLKVWLQSKKDDSFVRINK